MATPIDAHLREQLLARRGRLQRALDAAREDAAARRLLGEVDAALARFEHGEFGLCQTCHEPIEAERLLADPLTCFCLDHLTEAQRRALEEDVELAARVQEALLPARRLQAGEWDVAYHYQGSGPTSGDFCDVLPGPDGALHVVLGDVSGKGLAAALLMSHLHATFRALVPLALPLPEMVSRASRAFCESTLPHAYATAICGILRPGGDVEICNAGHPPALLAGAGEVRALGATGLPLGLFCDESFTSARLALAPAEALVLYTDGVTEALDPRGRMYGDERLRALVGQRSALPADALVAACLADHRAHVRTAPASDDVTVMAIRRRDPA